MILFKLIFYLSYISVFVYTSEDPSIFIDNPLESDNPGDLIPKSVVKIIFEKPITNAIIKLKVHLRTQENHQATIQNATFAPVSTTQPPTQPNIEAKTDPATSEPKRVQPTTAPPEPYPPTTTLPETNPPATTPPETDPSTTTPPETDPSTTTPPETDPSTMTPPETDPSTMTPPETDPSTTTPPETDPPTTTLDNY